MVYKIAILGDFNPSYSTHHALNDSIRYARKRFKQEIQCDWIATDMFDPDVVFNKLYSGLWIVPGSPYKSMESVIKAIYYTRTKGIPTLGSCAGFQHMLIEYAKNVCGIKNADHEETSSNSSDLIISKLSCSLVGQEEELTVIDTESKLFKIIKKKKFKGKYFCSYGLNKKYVDILKENGCSMTVVSPDGEIRAFELKSHPFFLGTLFQPSLTSSYRNPNPLIVNFFKSCINYSTLLYSNNAKTE